MTGGRAMENVYRDIAESASYIGKMIRGEWDTAVILGSGLGELGEEMEDSIKVPYRDIPHFPETTVQGHAGNLIAGRLGSKRIVALQGRFHFYEGYDMAQVVFPVRVLRAIGVKRLILTNAAGAVNGDLRPGDLMTISDHINLTFKNPLIGKNVDQLGPRFPDMSEVYSGRLIGILKDACRKNGVEFKSGTYACLTGPSYETPAEIRMLRFLGADAVGMSTVPEAIAAAHAGCEVAGISCITNMAAGIAGKPLSHQEVMDTSNAAGCKFRSVIRDFINAL